MRRAPRPGEHLRRHVHADRAPGRTDAVRREEHVHTRPAPEVHDDLARLQTRVTDRVPAPFAEDRLRGDPGQLLLRVAGGAAASRPAALRARRHSLLTVPFPDPLVNRLVPCVHDIYYCHVVENLKYASFHRLRR